MHECMNACMHGWMYVRAYVCIVKNQHCTPVTNIVWYRLPVDELPIKRAAFPEATKRITRDYRKTARREPAAKSKSHRCKLNSTCFTPT